jgi:hypothetical protein
MEIVDPATRRPVLGMLGDMHETLGRRWIVGG